MSWLLLILAGLLEVVWAIGLKYTDNFTRFWPSLITISTMLLSVWLLNLSLKDLPVGVAYAVWSGIGVLGTLIAGVILLGEAFNTMRVVGVVLLLAGLVCLQLDSNH